MFPAGDARFRVSTITIDSVAGPLALRVVECGDVHAADMCVLVHGWACSAYSFAELMPLLADRGIRSIAIDLPGHGLSDKPAERAVYRLDPMTRVVLDAMTALGVARAVVAGHSMGGTIAARMGAVAADRVRGLALLAPVGFRDEWLMRLGELITPPFIAPILPALTPRWLYRIVLAYTYGSDRTVTERDVDEYWAPTQFPGHVRALWQLMHAFDWDAGLDRGFGTITAPTQVMVGEQDHLLVRTWANRFGREIPGATMDWIARCGHVVPAEVPDRVAAVIARLASS